MQDKKPTPNKIPCKHFNAILADYHESLAKESKKGYYYSMRKWVIILVLGSLILKTPVYATNTDSASTEKKSKDGAVSILKFIPGVWQLKSGKTLKGFLLLSSFLGTTISTVVYNQQGNNWYKKYQTSTNVSEIIAYRLTTEKKFKNRNLSLIGLCTVWLAHIIDLKFFKSGKAGVTSEAGKKKIAFGFYYSF